MEKKGGEKEGFNTECKYVLKREVCMCIVWCVNVCVGACVWERGECTSNTKTTPIPV